jgi:hypothetical protein
VSPLALTQRTLEEHFNQNANVKPLCVEDLREPTHPNGLRTRTKDGRQPTQSSDLAYIITPSARRARPGVAIEHRQAVNSFAGRSKPSRMKNWLAFYFPPRRASTSRH